MSAKEKIELAIAALTAIGTISVAVLAIWGDWFRAKLARGNLVIELRDARGFLTHFNTMFGSAVIPSPTRKVYFYHLLVVNKRPWLAARNCRVLLKGINKRGPDGDFKPVPMPVSLQFIWAPQEASPTLATVTDEQTLDFGTCAEIRNGLDQGGFVPRLYSYTNAFPGVVGAGEAIRYSLQVVSDTFSSENYHVFEVAWDGKWSEQKEEMEHHLSVKEIK